MNGSLSFERNRSFKSQKVLRLDNQEIPSVSHYPTPFQGCVDLALWFISFFALSAAKRAQMPRNKLPMEVISDEELAFESLQSGLKKYGHA